VLQYYGSRKYCHNTGSAYFLPEIVENGGRGHILQPFGLLNTFVFYILIHIFITYIFGSSAFLVGRGT